MNETIIRWTDSSWNPVSGCSKVSDGCRFCYAMTISLKFKQTSKPWTIQNEAENVVIKPHKLHEPYTLGAEPRGLLRAFLHDDAHGQVFIARRPEFALTAMRFEHDRTRYAERREIGKCPLAQRYLFAERAVVLRLGFYHVHQPLFLPHKRAFALSMH